MSEVEPRTEQARQKEVKKIEEYKHLVALVEAKVCRSFKSIDDQTKPAIRSGNVNIRWRFFA